MSAINEEGFYIDESMFDKPGPENGFILINENRLAKTSPTNSPILRNCPNNSCRIVNRDTIYLDRCFRIAHIDNSFLFDPEFAEKMIGRPFCSLFPNTSDAEETASILKRVVAEDASWSLEGVISRHNAAIYARMRLSRISMHSEVRILVSVEDRTEDNRRREVYKKLACMLNILPCGTAEFFPENPEFSPKSQQELLNLLFRSRLAGANDRFLQMHGFNAADDLQHVMFRDLLNVDGMGSGIFEDQHRILFPRVNNDSVGGALVNYEIICNCPNSRIEGFLIICSSATAEIFDEDLSALVETLREERNNISDFAIDLEAKVKDLTRRAEDAKDEADQYSSKLEKTNDALKVLISGIEEQRKAAERKVTDKFKLAVQPILNQLRGESLPHKVAGLLNSLEMQLEKISSEYGGNVFKISHLLTFRELRICELINSGLSSKEIGEILGISPQTIFFHRSNIRKKLGLTGSSGDLASYLKSIG